MATAPIATTTSIIDNKSTTYRRVVKDNSLGIEFAGNFPDVRKPATPAQREALIEAAAVPAGALPHPAGAHLRA